MPGCSTRPSCRPTRAAISILCRELGRRRIRGDQPPERTLRPHKRRAIKQGETMIARSMPRFLHRLAATAAVLFVTSASAQEVKHYRFAYDQPRNTGYSIAGDI